MTGSAGSSAFPWGLQCLDDEGAELAREVAF